MNKKLTVTILSVLVLTFGTACQHVRDIAGTVVPPVAIELGENGIVVDSQAIIDTAGTSFLCLDPDGAVASTLTGLPLFLGDIGGFVVNDLIGACKPAPEVETAPTTPAPTTP